MAKFFYPIILFFLSTFTIQSTFGQSFSLVRDINPGPEYEPPRPANLTEAGGLLFFQIASGPNAGLWKTDGSEAATVQVKAVAAPEQIEAVVGSGNLVFFTIYNSSTGTTRLWKTDGTQAGTIRLLSVSGYRILSPVAINGNLFFVVNSGGVYDLWKSNGSPGGGNITILQSGNIAIEKLTNVNGTLFFTAADPSVPYHRLWKSDGTAGGTVLVKDISAGGGNPVFLSLFNANGTLFFTANDRVNGAELWKSDGTDAGTVMLKDIEPGLNGSSIRSFAMINNDVYFLATTSANAICLWKSDGTPEGTTMAVDIADNPYYGLEFIVSVNGALYFQLYDEIHGMELWKSDGTPGGTFMLKDLRPGDTNSFPAALSNQNGTLYFTVSSFDIEVWKSDGTEAGTVLVQTGFKRVLDGRVTIQFVMANGQTYFSPYEPHFGYELWKTDGTTAGTNVVKNILSSPDSSPQGFIAGHGVVYFAALNYVNSPFPVLGDDIFRTDGTFAGTAKAERIDRFHSSALDMAMHNGELFISAMNHQIATNSPDYELWKVSAIGAAAVKVKDIDPREGTIGSMPDNFQSVGPSLFFSANDGVTGRELWKSDGTNAGTVLVKDINPSGNSNPVNLVNVNGVLYFTANNGSDGIELWKSDGTAAGTVMIKNIHPISNSNPAYLTAVNGVLYFTADEGINGIELWKSDGTAAGTVLVKNINGIGSSSPASLTNVNGVLYFSADDGSNGVEVWKSNGTDAGTVLVKDINFGPNSSNPTLFTNLNGFILFAADDGNAGRELWGSDGTGTGTFLIKDIQTGVAGSNPAALKKIGNNVLFAADDGIHGSEVWLSNGVEAGTRMMDEIQPGAAGSNPTEIFEFGSKVLVAATHNLFGSEVWIADVPAGSPLPLDLLEFKGIIVSHDGVLQWKTDNESNTSSFIIERSLDGRNYQAIGSVTAANTPGVHFYDFTDINITSLGKNDIFYRLKQTDIDGRFTYSNIVVLSIVNDRPVVMLYPNPARNSFNITITISQSEKLQWQLSDKAGRIVKQGNYNLSPGSTALNIPIADLSSGIYLLKLDGAILKEVFKVIKQ